MSKVGTIVGVAAVSSLLFAGAYVGVAAAKGAPLREIPPMSWFVEPAPHADVPGAHAPAPLAAAPAEREESPVVAPMTAGVLGAFVLPSPFDSRELQALQKQLTERIAKVDATEKALETRARELDDWQKTLEERSRELDEIRAQIGGAPAPAKTTVVAPSEPKPLDADEQASWRAMSPLFEEGDAEELAGKLAAFTPEEAALILKTLEPERAAALLNALPKDRYKAFFDAWRRVKE